MYINYLRFALTALAVCLWVFLGALFSATNWFFGLLVIALVLIWWKPLQSVLGD